MQELAATAADKMKDVTDRAEKIATDVADQAKMYGEKAQEVVSQVKPYVERSLREQPFATLAAFSLLGFVLGALWKK